MDQKADATRAADSMNSDPPLELDDINYVTEVLQIPRHQPETWLDEELEAKAISLGLSVSRPTTPNVRNTFSTQSASTVATYAYPGRNSSIASNRSTSTSLTNHSSVFGVSGHKPLPHNPRSASTSQSRELDYHPYEAILRDADGKFAQTQLSLTFLPDNISSSNMSSAPRRRSLFSLPPGIKDKIKRRKSSLSLATPRYNPPRVSRVDSSRRDLLTTIHRVCNSCTADLNSLSVLHHLPCGHEYCLGCLTDMVKTATVDESKMPPRCCTQPVPAVTIQELLDLEIQEAFLEAVERLSAPKESGLFCIDRLCGEYLPRGRLNLKHPSTRTCLKCGAGICISCKQTAHAMNWDCPGSSRAVQDLKGSGGTLLRRCYKCGRMANPIPQDPYVICECHAHFCYTCGAVWDGQNGCPNLCNAVLSTAAHNSFPENQALEDSVETLQAEKRTKEHPDFQLIRQTEQDELGRFLDFLGKSKESMRERQSVQRQALLTKYVVLEDAMNERHARAANQLEDRQISGEMELRNTLEQSKRSLLIRLKHMEAYCHGLGQSPTSPDFPPRTVTERDLRELGQQYNIRDNMDHLHQAKINVLRDRQSKQMAELLAQQEAELENLQQEREIESKWLAAQFIQEDDLLNHTFMARQRRMTRRWELGNRILCKELEQKHGTVFVYVPPPAWPKDNGDAMATAVTEGAESLTTQ
ncbi:hypothetical protein S40288_04340 [Stachybotrys chartarum IBT 40288]|nr:hypothetical protein S40288_04340 [Stachybotrys chartarum IBT 40288]